ncbi:MAG: MmgE/PrpD family protein [Acetobacteraceae bacterium]|nr:MmgE/PrpD family protein [Acetobacteraceae bacterium]
MLLADTLAAILAGHRQPELRALVARHAVPLGAAPASYVPLLGTPHAAPPPMAAFLTGLAGTAVELDEGNYPAGGHPAIHALAAALAEAPLHPHATGADLLAAFEAGYEAGARIGAATTLRPAAHPHGTWGVIGAAAAVAHLRRLDAAATQRTLDIAASLGLATSATASLRGGSVRNAYAGAAAQNGMLAVDLMQAGVTGEPGGIAVVFGNVIGSAYDESRIPPGRLFEKPFIKAAAACCRETQGALEAIETLLDTQPLGDPDAIEAIEVATFASAALLDERAPVAPIAGRFSIPFTIATRLIQGHAWIEAFEEPALSDPGTRALAAKVAVREDPALTALLPARRVCRLTLRLRDGTARTAEVVGTPGDPDRPLPESALREKFRRCAEPGFGTGWERLWHLARDAAAQPSAAALIRAFQPPAP